MERLCCTRKSHAMLISSHGREHDLEINKVSWLRTRAVKA